MSYRITKTLTPGQTITAPLTSSLNVKCVEAWNSSPYDIDYIGPGAPGQLLLPGGVADRYFVENTDPVTGKVIHYNPGSIQITPNDNVGAGGTSYINFLVYELDDVIPDGTFPVAIPFQKVKATVTSVTQLINIGGIAGLNVIQVQPQGDSNFTTTLNNVGVMTLGDILHPGSLTISGNGTVNPGTLTVTGLTEVGTLSIDGLLNSPANAPSSGGAGNFDVDQWFSGKGTGGYNKVLIKFNSGFKNGSSTLNFTLAVPFKTWCKVEFSDAPTFSLLKSSTAQNCTMTTTYDNPSTVTASVTSLTQISAIGMMNGGNGVDTIQFAAGGTQAAHNGYILLEGV